MKNLFLLLFLTSNLTLFSQENIDLFIWAGQSNAMGRQGDAAQYPDDVNNLDNQIRFNWTVANGGSSNEWTTMQPQTGFFPDGHFGPEVTFSRKLVQAGYNPAIFKYTQGATSIFQHWLGPNDGGLYDDMTSSLNNAISVLENQGHSVNIRGLIWIQGESDSNSEAAANAYYNNLTTILTDFRDNVTNIPNLPILLGVDEQFFNIVGQERNQILNAHQDIALNDPNIKFTSMYGYPKADDTHLTPEGLISHGEDLFSSYELLISNNYPSGSCNLSSEGNHDSFARTSWGQSFNTDCSGILSSLTFEAISNHNTSATITLYNSADCSGTVLASQVLNTIEIGDNNINFLENNIYIDKEHTYFFEITSNSNSTWMINFSDVDNVFGVLRCTSNDEIDNCGKTFLNYDMDFSTKIIANTDIACTISASGSEVSFERASWGQSFVPPCTGPLSSITFSAASTLSGNAIFTLYAGLDCNSNLILTQPLAGISLGDNTINLNSKVSLLENSTYFFQIVSNDNSFWKIHYSNIDLVDGLLHTFRNESYCERTFPNFDMNFSIMIEDANSSCLNETEIYSFNYDNKTYEIVKRNKSWTSAVVCALERGGELVRINSSSEQDALWNELHNNADINLENTIASNGGEASYVWIGGSDLASEGNWIWDGDNDGNGDQFWQGDANGNPVGGLFSNWGNEPDNIGNQDGLAIALTQWPINSGSIGSEGQWNDLIVNDLLYFVIEYDKIVSTHNYTEAINIFPNPVNNWLNISNSDKNIKQVLILNSIGQEIADLKISEPSKLIKINFSNYKKGVYFMQVNFTNGNSVTQKIIK